VKTAQLRDTLLANQPMSVASTAFAPSVERKTQVEVSIVMPCLNEAETLGGCLEKAKAGLRLSGFVGEIIVADNGSTDGSIQIAANAGVRVVDVKNKGYGNALIGGISAAQGRYIVMGDSDNSHDYSHVPRFIDKLEQGSDMVVGNRIKGEIEPGAMSPLHRYLGTPVLSGIGRLFYRSHIGDFNCGLRAFTREAWESMDLRSPGMEFASEMIVRASLVGLRIAEVPTSMAKDGRNRPPHLRTWRDGWRHLRLLLLYCPRWLFLYPGAALFMLGMLTLLASLAGPRQVGEYRFDTQALVYGAFAMMIGFQAIFFAAFSKILGVTQGVLPQDKRLNGMLQFITLETGLVAGFLSTFAGIAYLAIPLVWFHVTDAVRSEGQLLRIVIPGVVAVTLGIQTIFCSFLLSMLGLTKRQ
jgi:glycosyltransferase involved in cell wall biosynthesis